MTWLLFAFSGPVLWAISVHLDKYIVDRYFRETSVAVLLVFTSLIGLLSLPVIWHFRPDVLDLSWTSIGLIMFAGFLYMTAMYFYLQALQGEEASVVAPFFQASPLFAYGLAYVVLGETLTPIQLLGGALVIGGVLLLSWRRGQRRAAFKLRLALLMSACAFALSIASVIFKRFALEDEFWPTTFWMFIGEAIYGIGVLSIRSFRRQFLAVLRANPGPVLAVNGANELINLGGGLCGRYAALLAPLSLVQAIGSTTTLFVFLFGVLLTLLVPKLGREDLSLLNLAQKASAALLVAIGVVVMNR
jgi:uncharacterized membrane protein